MPQIDIHLFISHIIILYLLFFCLYWNIKSNNFFTLALLIKNRKFLKIQINKINKLKDEIKISIFLLKRKRN